LEIFTTIYVKEDYLGQGKKNQQYVCPRISKCNLQSMDTDGGPVFSLSQVRFTLKCRLLTLPSLQ